ncbi:MAG: protein-export chaperone SecB [Hyphomicrobiales bacterium]|nr:protein-export chaperone SecB [Hyphomicrobiales bacterium]MDE2283799.1 protein-export chaperone SecB [Hyphomicrobiales bacterium]
MSASNGGPANPQVPPPEVGMPQIAVLTQYVKDFSFENPNAPRSLTPGEQPPSIGIRVNVDAAPLSAAPFSAAPVTGTDFEVTLRLDGKAEAQKVVLFSFELVYGGVFRVQNVAQENLQPVVMIECPRLMFPFAREIVATAVRNGGFPPLLLDPIDFINLYRQRLAAAQAPAPNAPINPN